MSYTTVAPERAKELLDTREWTYLDVRSVEEFEGGHPEGAFNVPLATMTPQGMRPNPEFTNVVRRNFAPDAKLILGCAMGGRSSRACEILAAEGFTELVNMHGGFSGARDESGDVVQAGWAACGFPVASGAPSKRCYGDLAGS